MFYKAFAGTLDRFWENFLKKVQFYTFNATPINTHIYSQSQAV